MRATPSGTASLLGSPVSTLASYMAALKREMQSETSYQVDKLVASKLDQYHIWMSQLEKQNASLQYKLAALNPQPLVKDPVEYHYWCPPWGSHPD